MNLKILLKPLVILPCLALVISPVFAQVRLRGFSSSVRYPTDKELQQLSREFSRHLQDLLSGDFRIYLDDSRTPEEKQKRDRFVSTWSKANPEVAPFLGSWVGYEQGLAIYPSIVPDRVCLIEGDEEGFVRFAIGSVSSGKIYTNDNEIVFMNNGYLGIAWTKDSQASLRGDMPLNNPRPLEPLNSQMLNRLSEDSSEVKILANRTMQAFREAGCTANLP